MRDEYIARRHNCRPVIAWREGRPERYDFFSIGEASRVTGMSRPAIRRAITLGSRTLSGWIFDTPDSERSAEPPRRTVKLSGEEIRELIDRLKQDIIHKALYSPYVKDYRWDLYDEIVKVARVSGFQINDSNDEYEYWRDWMDKNRDDLCDDCRDCDEEEYDD